MLRTLAAITCSVGLASAALAEPTRDYVVQDGDSCLAIVTRELGDARQLDAFHRLNPGMGAPPHKLTKGQILRLPVTTRVADAKLGAPRGRVEVNKPGMAEWAAGAQDEDLFRSWRVGTRERSSAKIVFADTSTIEMREDTVVVIFGSRSTTRTLSRTTLERGVLRSRLAQLDGKPRVSVDTPAGSAVLTDGSAVIDVDGKGETRVANHAGAAARLAGKTGAAVAIKSGYGSKVKPGKPPEAPRPLPPAPSWPEPESLMLGWKGQPIAVRGEWTEVAAASKYRIEIVRASAPDAVEARLEVPASIHKLDVSELPAADYAITVATVDLAGLESIPSTPWRVRMIELEPPGALLAGAELAIPAGLRCQAGRTAPPAEAAPVTSLRLSRDDDGRARITCAAGAATSTIEVEIPAARAAVSAEAPRARPGETFTIDVATEGVAASAIRATGRGGVEVLSVEPIERGVRIHARATAPTPEAAVVVAVVDAAAPLATIGVTVEGKTGSRLAPAPQHLRWFALGVFGGTSVDRRGGDEVLLGAEVDVSLSSWVSSHLSVSRGRGSSSTYLLGATLGIPGRIRPFLRLGASFTNDRVGAHAGLGFEVPLAPWLALRAHLDTIAETDDAFVHMGAGVVVHW